MTQPKILCVDDNADDLMLLRMACTAAKVSFQLLSIDCGEKAIAYLEGADGYADRERFPLPVLILLDLKMPGCSGFDVLAWVRSRPHFDNLPVIIFTSSIHPEDRTRAQALGASQFLVKPIGYEALQKLVQSLDQFLATRQTLDQSLFAFEAK